MYLRIAFLNFSSTAPLSFTSNMIFLSYSWSNDFAAVYIFCISNLSTPLEASLLKYLLEQKKNCGVSFANAFASIGAFLQVCNTFIVGSEEHRSISKSDLFFL